MGLCRNKVCISCKVKYRQDYLLAKFTSHHKYTANTFKSQLLLRASRCVKISFQRTTFLELNFVLVHPVVGEMEQESANKMAKNQAKPEIS